MKRRKFGPDDPETLRSRNNLADGYRAAGMPDKAIPLFEQTLTSQERILDPDDKRVIGTRSNLALAYRDAGQLR